MLGSKPAPYIDVAIIAPGHDVRTITAEGANQQLELILEKLKAENRI